MTGYTTIFGIRFRSIWLGGNLYFVCQADWNGRDRIWLNVQHGFDHRRMPRQWGARRIPRGGIPKQARSARPISTIKGGVL